MTPQIDGAIGLFKHAFVAFVRATSRCHDRNVVAGLLTIGREWSEKRAACYRAVAPCGREELRL